jgi:hypothetical protein
MLKLLFITLLILNKNLLKLNIYMKKLILCLLLFVAIVASATPAVAPVPVTIYSGYSITSAGSTEVELQFGDIATVNATKTTVYVQVASGNSGTIQFSVGREVDASHAAYAAGSKIPITITNGTRNLRYKASAASQTFTVTH